MTEATDWLIKCLSCFVFKPVPEAEPAVAANLGVLIYQSSLAVSDSLLRFYEIMSAMQAAELCSYPSLT